MAIALVNHSNFVNNSTSTSSFAAPAINVALGNLVVAFCRCGGSNSISSVTDTAGNTYTQIGTTQNSGPIGCAALFYAKNTIANASNVITCNLGSSQSFQGITVIQYSGVDTTAPLDASALSNTGSSATSATTGAFSTVQADEVSVAGYTANTTGDTYSAGTGYTLRDNNSGFGGIEDQTFASTQSGVTASASSVGSHTWIVLLATFKGLGGVADTLMPQIWM